VLDVNAYYGESHGMSFDVHRGEAVPQEGYSRLLCV